MNSDSGPCRPEQNASNVQKVLCADAAFLTVTFMRIDLSL